MVGAVSRIASFLAMVLLASACAQEARPDTGFSVRKVSEILVGNAIIDVTAISDDGRYVAYNEHNDLVQVFDARTGRLVSSFRVSQRGVKQLRFSPDGRQLAVMDWESGGQLRDVRSGELLFEMTETERNDKNNRKTGSGGDVVFSPNGEIVFSDLAKSGVESYNTATGRSHRYYFHDRTASSKSLGVSSNGLYLAKVPTLGPIELWYLPTNELVDTSSAFLGWKNRDPSILEFSPDGNLLAEGSVFEDTVNVWRLNGKDSPKLVQRIGRASSIVGLEWSPDSRRLLVGEANNPPSLWNIELGTTLRMFEPSLSGQEESMSISRHGIIAIEGPETLRTRQEHEEHLQDLARKIETGEHEFTLFGKPMRSVFLWSLDDMSSNTRLPIPAGDIDAVIFSRDGSTLAVNGDDKIYVFEVRS